MADTDARSESGNEQLVRQFFDTLSTGDLEALRALIHPDGSWEVMGTTIPGAGLTSGRDSVIDEDGQVCHLKDYTAYIMGVV